jgi:hypothetical protein
LEKSENFDSGHEELKNTIENLRIFIQKFQENLENSKMYSKKKLHELSELSKLADSTIQIQEKMEKELNLDISSLYNNTLEELETISKLSTESLEKTNEVHEKALNILRDVNYLDVKENIYEVENSINIFRKDGEINANNYDNYLKDNEELFYSFLVNLDLAEKHQLK